jgi:hypothetical protein
MSFLPSPIPPERRQHDIVTKLLNNADQYEIAAWLANSRVHQDTRRRLAQRILDETARQTQMLLSVIYTQWDELGPLSPQPE